MRYFKDLSSFNNDLLIAELQSLLASQLAIDIADVTKYLFVPLYGGIGDCLPAAVFASQIHKYHSIAKERIYFLVSRSKAELIPLMNLDEYRYSILEDSFLPKLASLTGFGVGRIAYSTKAYIMNGGLEPLMLAHSIPFLDIIKASFKLPLRLEYQYQLAVNISSAQDELRSKGISFSEEESNVILFPYSSFGERLPHKSWQEIAEALIESGFSVYTNTSNKTLTPAIKHSMHKLMLNYEEIPGSLPLSVSLNALAYLFLHFPCIPVHGQGGIAYFTALLPARKRFAIYSMPKQFDLMSKLTSSHKESKLILPHSQWNSFELNLPGRFQTYYNTKDEIRSLVNHVR